MKTTNRRCACNQSARFSPLAYHTNTHADTAGEVPNLFAKDELVSIMEAVTPRAKRAGKPLTPAGLWDYFLDSVRVNLHLVLTMSPVGGAFRERLRK